MSFGLGLVVGVIDCLGELEEQRAKDSSFEKERTQSTGAGDPACIMDHRLRPVAKAKW